MTMQKHKQTNTIKSCWQIFFKKTLKFQNTKGPVFEDTALTLNCSKIKREKRDGEREGERERKQKCVYQHDANPRTRAHSYMTKSVCVCVWERERESVCLWVWEWERVFAQRSKVILHSATYRHISAFSQQPDLCTSLSFSPSLHPLQLNWWQNNKI